MKTLFNNQISALKMLATILFIFTFSSCSKVSSKCEEWEVMDERVVNEAAHLICAVAVPELLT